MPLKSESLSGFFQILRRRKGIVMLALVVLGSLVLAARAVGLRELMNSVVIELRGAGAPAFFLAMAILPAVGFPLLPFSLAAGPVFAPVLGTGGVIACAILAVAVNVALSYALASTWLRSLVERLMVRFGYRLPEPRRDNAWLLITLVRLAPGLPFCVQSYLLGLMRVRFGAYMVVSTLVPASYLTGVIVFGEAMMQGNRSVAVGAVALIVGVGAGLYFLRRRMAAKARHSAATDLPL